MIDEFELQNITIDEKLLGDNAKLYHCSYNGEKYIYKKLMEFDDEILNKLSQVMLIKNPSLNIPSYIVCNNGKPVGFLLEPYYDYKLAFFLQWYNIKDRINFLKMAKEKIIEMHKHGIIHCDLHPANIMFCKKNSDVKIIDFDSCYFNGLHPSINNMNINCQYYLKNNNISNSLDIFIFNITTISILYKIAFSDVLRPRFQTVTEAKLENEEQSKIWQKIKQKEELTYDDFFIDTF